MATTRLSDVIVPEVFYPYMMKKTMETTAFFQSGILRPDPSLSTFLSGGGLTTNVPFYNDLSDANDAGIGSDDPNDKSTPDNIGASKDVGIRNIRTKSWSDMDLVRELTGSDPMEAIADRVSEWWGRSFQRHAIATIRGVMADNIANDNSDMVVDIGTDAAGAPGDTELISAEAVIDAKQTMGDAAENLTALAVHSVVHSRLQKLNLIDYIPDSEGKIMFPSYLGYRLVIDDGLPAIAGTNRVKYHSYLFAEGAMAFSESPVAVPVEADRNPDAGNGTGQEILYTRRQYILHPHGVKWTDASRAGNFPTNAECLNAANWDRVYPERKQVPIATLITNG